MKNDALNQMSGAYGSKRIESGAQTVTAPTTCFEAWEETVFGVFKDLNSQPITGHNWAGKTLPIDKTAFFGLNVFSFTIVSGGFGQIFLSE